MDGEKEKMLQLLAVTAVFSNHVSIVHGGLMTRLTFGETFPVTTETKPVYYHTGITMMTNDALELAETIFRVNGLTPPVMAKH